MYNVGDEPVPGYKLVSFLGRGGFGEVWKASAPGGTEAALKMIHLGGTEGRKEFRSLQVVKRIHHPNLVPISAFWLRSDEGGVLDDSLTALAEADSTEPAAGPLNETMTALPNVSQPVATELIIAMGLGDKSLHDRLKECREAGLTGIPQDELLDYMECAARAIDYLNNPIHDLGSGPPAAIQHCDIKPQNLMIVGGATQVCDFGLARVMGVDRSTTAAATIAYAAPEYLETGKPSETTDQYALAVSYFELRTGTLPYTDETIVSVMQAKREGTLNFSKLSGAEQGVLRRGTSQDPQGRFPSAAAMAAALREAATGAAPTADFAEPPARPAHRRRLATVVTLLALVAVVGLGAYVAAVQNGYIQGWPLGGAAGPVPGDDDDDVPEDRRPVPGDSDGRQQPKVTQTPGDLAEAAACFKRACQSLEKGDHDAAIAEFEKAIELDADAAEPEGYESRPEYAEAYLARGTSRLELQEFAGAVADLTRAGELSQQDARIFSRLGVAWLQQEKWEQAAGSFVQAVQIDPDDQGNERDYVNLGRACRGWEQFPKAIEALTEAIRLNPLNADAHYLQADCHLQMEESDKAAVAFGKAIDHYAEYAGSATPTFLLQDAYLYRGACYMQEGQFDDAATDFDEVLRLNPEGLAGLDSLLELLADHYEQAGRSTEAAKWAEEAAKAKSGGPPP